MTDTLDTLQEFIAAIERMDLTAGLTLMLTHDVGRGADATLALLESGGVYEKLERLGARLQAGLEAAGITTVRHGSLVVDDDGPGIPVADRANVFDRFWRGDAGTRGPGLGLSIVQKLVRITM